MMKEATKCRQYEPEDDMAMLGFLLRNHNKALASLWDKKVYLLVVVVIF